jgi:hypothetical protein
MGSRWRERLAFHLALRLEVPKPPFTWFKALHDGMPGGVEVLARVLARGAVAAADVSAFRTAAKMKPPTAGGQTLHASSTTWRNRRINARNVFLHESLPGDAYVVAFAGGTSATLASLVSGRKVKVSCR